MSWPVCIDTEREDVRRRSSRGPGHGCGQEGCGQEARQCQLTLRPQAIPVVAAGGRNPCPGCCPREGARPGPATEGPIHPVAAVRYVHAAHPDKALPRIR